MTQSSSTRLGFQRLKVAVFALLARCSAKPPDPRPASIFAVGSLPAVGSDCLKVLCFADRDRSQLVDAPLQLPVGLLNCSSSANATAGTTLFLTNFPNCSVGCSEWNIKSAGDVFLWITYMCVCVRCKRALASHTHRYVCKGLTRTTTRSNTVAVRRFALPRNFRMQYF